MALSFICVLLSGSNVVTTLSSPPFRMSVHLCPCTIVRPGLPFSCLRKLVDAALIPHTFLSTWTLARAASQAAANQGFLARALYRLDLSTPPTWAALETLLTSASRARKSACFPGLPARIAHSPS